MSVNDSVKNRPGSENVLPYGEDSHKTSEVRRMFDAIAPHYDFMNTAMTFGLHRYWRDVALKSIGNYIDNSAYILDVATGTGDVAFRLADIFPHARIRGIDLSAGMLEVAGRKAGQTGLDSRVSFEQADCLSLPFERDTFNAVTVAYGVRNFERLADGYKEMLRVLKPGGILCVIELSTPRNPLMRRVYNLYSRYLIPVVGRLVSGDTRAYSYLPESIAACPQREEMVSLMESSGFVSAQWKSLFPGAVTIYTAFKRE